MSTKYTKELLQEAVNNSYSYSGVLRHLGLKQAGGTQSHIINRIKKFNINTDHFLGQAWSKGKASSSKKSPEDILIILKNGSSRAKTKQLKRAMLEMGMEYFCNECGVKDIWNNKLINLEIDHIDGNWYNNLISNLRFLCPNCHSQQTNTNRSHKNKSSINPIG